jgi:hypothetical protein
MKSSTTWSFLVLLLWSCATSNNFKKDRVFFEASKEIIRFKSVADMNDSYFVIKENNFFEFYRQLFDSIKNSSYPGKYTKKDDTLLLHFYNKKGADLLGTKAWIAKEKKQILFFR